MIEDCSSGKQCLSKHEAETMKQRIGRDKGKDMRIYECPECFTWHLTKRINSFISRDKKEL